MSALDGWQGDDAFFGPVRIDKDERSDRVAPHRFVHGSFEGTDTRFAVWLPEHYEERLVQYLQGGMGGNEHQGANLNGPQIAFGRGAVYVESNQGHIGNDLSGIKGDMTILTWRASRQAALFAKSLAEEHYGAAPRRSYLVGGSGGGLRGIECLERCPDVWDGAVPFIINRNGLVTYNWSVLCWATLVLGEARAGIVDATDAGGSGDPFAHLDEEQRDALSTLYDAGFCRGAEAQIEPSPLWVLGLDIVGRADGGFFDEFWKVPGYAGSDGSPVVDRLVFEGEGTVRALRTAGELRGIDADDLLSNVVGQRADAMVLGAVLDGVAEPARLLGATLRVSSPDGPEREMRCTGLLGDAVTAILDPIGFRGVKPGDRVTFDNRDLIAFAHHHRHLVGDVYPEMRRFVRDGVPVHPQRPIPFAALPVPSGRFAGKMILIQHAADKECWPSCARAYAASVHDQLGDRVNDQFRLWWHENAAHLVPNLKAGRTRLVEYGGVFAQALFDLTAWVEEGTPPPASTSHSFTSDNALVLAPTARDRGGIQPVVRATVNGAARADVGVDESFVLSGTADLPEAAGSVVGVAWDLDGRGDFAVATAAASDELEHSYDAPGTYFATLRVTTHRDGDATDRLRAITNLARVRIVVS